MLFRSSSSFKNPRIGKVLKLEEEAKRQNELEQLRSKRIRQQQEYINQMIDSVEANLKNTKEEQKLNEEFERHRLWRQVTLYLRVTLPQVS